MVDLKPRSLFYLENMCEEGAHDPALPFKECWYRKEHLDRECIHCEIFRTEGKICTCDTLGEKNESACEGAAIFECCNELPFSVRMCKVLSAERSPQGSPDPPSHKLQIWTDHMSIGILSRPVCQTFLKHASEIYLLPDEHSRTCHQDVLAQLRVLWITSSEDPSPVSQTPTTPNDRTKHEFISYISCHSGARHRT